jgi:hypothetical protein
LSTISASRCRHLARTAISAVLGLWDDGCHTFWRSTEQRKRETGETHGHFFPTVSVSSAEGLMRVLRNAPDLVESIGGGIASRVVSLVASRPISDFTQSSLELGEPGELNPFTGSLLLSTIALAARRQGCPKNEREELLRKSRDLVETLCGSSVLRLGDGRVHPFLLFHAHRAVRQAPGIEDPTADRVVELIDDLEQGCIHTCNELFARDRLGLLTPGDAVALAFCAATLVHSERTESAHYVVPSMKLALDAQDQAGCWPLGRVIPEDKDIKSSRLEMSTYEVAWALSEVASTGIRRRHDDLLRTMEAGGLIALERALDYAEGSVVRLGDKERPPEGWCSDHAYGKPIIESWTSANVLQLAVSLADVHAEMESLKAMKTFVHGYPGDGDWPRWLKWSKLKSDSEPDTQARILDYLDRKIVEPIRLSERELPDPRAETVSAVLFGPPGTSKTTIARGIAEALGWAVVFLSPGSFISKGLEYIEAEAADIFSRLHKLRRAVVVFDECDELFRERAPAAGIEQMRGITAFVTASMLPKLQALHDRGSVVFFVLTNHFYSLDPAMRRSGRIDHLVAVGPPDDEGRQRLITSAFPRARKPVEEAAIAELAAKTDGFTRSEVLRLAKELATNSDWTTATEARKFSRRLSDSLGPSREISEAELKLFREQRAKWSRPHLEIDRNG